MFTRKYPILWALLLSAVLLPAAVSGEPGGDQFNFAEGLFIHKDYESALEEYGTYVNDYAAGKRIATARFRVAECYFRLLREKDAASAYDAALKQHADAPESTLAWYNLGRCRFVLTEYTPALTAFRNAMNSKRTDIREEAYVGAGESLLQLKRNDDAVQHFRSFLDTFPKSQHRPSALFSLGWTHVQRKAPRDAIAPLTELTQQHVDYKDHARAIMLLSDAYAATDQFDKADALLKPLTADAKTAEDALMRLAWTRYRSGDRKASARTFIQFAKAHPNSALLASALYNAGIAYYESKSYAEATNVFGRLLATKSTGPEAGDGRFWLGMALFELGKHAGVIATLTPLLAKTDLAAERRATLLYTYAEALAASGKTKDAVRWFQVLLKDLPKNKYAHSARHSLGIQLAEQGDLEGAVKALKQCLVAGPPDALRQHVQFALGEYLYRLGRLDESDTHLRATIAGGKSDAKTLYRIGWVAYDSGRSQEAATYFEKLAGIKSPFAAEALYMAGRSQEQAKQPAKTIAAYESLVARSGTDVNSEKAFYRLSLIYPAAKALTHLKGYAARFPQGGQADLVQTRLAELHFDAGDFSSAANAYRSALGKDPDAEAAAVIRYGLGWSYLKQDKLAEADAEFAQLGDNPTASVIAADALLQRGEIAYRKKAYDKARPFFERLVNDKGARGERAHYMLGWCAQHEGRKDDSVRHFSALVEQFPKGPLAEDAALRLAESYMKSGDNTKAHQVLEAQVKRLDDDAGEPLLQRYADTLVRLERWQDVLHVSEAMTKDTQNTNRLYLVFFRLGLANKGLGLYEDARGHFKETIKHTDSIEAAKAQFNIAATYYSERDYSTAAKQFLRVELLYDYGDLSPKALYHAVDAFMQADGAESRRAAIYLDKLRNNYASSEWTRKAAALADGKEGG